MAPEEKELRRKLAGLGISQSHIHNAVWARGSGPAAKQYKAKLKRVNAEIRVLRRQLDRLEREKAAADRMVWPVLFHARVSRVEFVKFWDRHYSGYDEEFYQQNIGQPLTEERIQALYEWKNGGPLSENKKKSILRYSRPEEQISADADEAHLREFLSRPGGAIWRIFWLHLQHPSVFPIYDQHVHRAMAFLRGWADPRIPNGNPAKIDMYLREYRPFFQQFEKLPYRSVDRALWRFGKFVGSGFSSVLGRRAADKSG